MEIKHLRYFIAVAENLNFTEAAKQLFIAQSAVSQQIADLERELGVRLFIRNKRSVKLTSAGSVFLKEAVDTIKKAEIAVQKARQADTGLIGNIRMGFLNSAVRRFMPEIIRKFHEKFPSVDLDLQQLTLAGLTAAIKSGGIDVGFTVSLGLNKISGVIWEKIYGDYSCIAVCAGHPLANKTTVDIASLAEEKFIVMSRQESPEGFDLILRLCADHGFSPNIVSNPPLMETVLFLVEAGLGVAIVPGSTKAYANPNLRFLEIEGGGGSMDVGMMWQKKNSNPSLPVFLEEMRKELAKVPQTGLVDDQTGPPRVQTPDG